MLHGEGCPRDLDSKESRLPPGISFHSNNLCAEQCWDGQDGERETDREQGCPERVAIYSLISFEGSWYDQRRTKLFPIGIGVDGTERGTRH